MFLWFSPVCRLRILETLAYIIICCPFTQVCPCHEFLGNKTLVYLATPSSAWGLLLELCSGDHLGYQGLNWVGCNKQAPYPVFFSPASLLFILRPVFMCSIMNELTHISRETRSEMKNYCIIHNTDWSTSCEGG